MTAGRIPLRTAILYSGRFYGELTPSWIDHHLESLIVPNNASVFVVADAWNCLHAVLEPRPHVMLTCPVCGRARAAWAGCKRRT
jgi:hypothetical protein